MTSQTLLCQQLCKASASRTYLLKKNFLARWVKLTYLNSMLGKGCVTQEPSGLRLFSTNRINFTAARYFEVEEKFVYCTEDRYVIDPEETVKLVDENTIGICAILGTTYTGEYEDVKKVNDLLVERGIDCPIHVDAASGGFVAPFVCPELVWDFRLEKVVSINVSGHKYGLVSHTPSCS